MLLRFLFIPVYLPVMAFFFQAEDGIRDYKVTGVQTCALPILLLSSPVHSRQQPHLSSVRTAPPHPEPSPRSLPWRTTSCWCRSEERRVGKECRCLWVGDLWKKKWCVYRAVRSP